MDLPLTEPDDTELNMTPMIDIVFQLIIFFLLSLKFKTLDHRIESMLPNEGLAATTDFVDEVPKIKLKVFRRHMENRDQAYTLVKLDNVRQFRLPEGWKGRAKESSERVATYDAVVDAIRTAIRGQVAAHGGRADQLKAEIVAPRPTGGSVPHGDVVALMDAFIEVGLYDVNFEGTPAPLTKRERAARDAGR